MKTNVVIRCKDEDEAELFRWLISKAIKQHEDGEGRLRAALAGMLLDRAGQAVWVDVDEAGEAF